MSGVTRLFYFPKLTSIVTSNPLTPEALRAAVDELGYELVDVQISGPASRRAVRLRIDRPGGSLPGAGVTSDDCQRVSRAMERRLEESSVVAATWTLEVSSPGIERPLRFIEHWRRHVGRAVRLKATGVTGSPTAQVVAVPDDTHVTVAFGGDVLTLSLEAIREATLVVDWSTLSNRDVGDI